MKKEFYMKLLNSVAQSDSNSSFLDVTLCLLVVFILLFAVAIVEVKNTAEKETKEKIETQMASKSEERKEDREKIVGLQKEIKKYQFKLAKMKDSKKVEIESVKTVEVKNTNRYRGRGGQPSIPISVYFDNEFFFKIGKKAYSWKDFRKLICNINRQEASKNPSLIFSMTFDPSFDNLSLESLNSYFKGKVSKYEIKKAIESNSRFQIISLLKKEDKEFEMSCRKFKLQFTSSDLGNWDIDMIGRRDFTEYSQRRSLDNPYLWFSVDKNRNVILGPSENHLKLSVEEFIDLIGSIEGGDGFYIEYRDQSTLKYNESQKTPDWVVKNIMDPAGFGNIAEI
jgi:hypothetical protein